MRRSNQPIRTTCKVAYRQGTLRDEERKIILGETLVQFDAPLFLGSDGPYYARACGCRNNDGLWEGWIEFTRPSDDKAVRTGRETTQPNHQDLVYWAGGLRPVYLEGALQRSVARPPNPPTPSPPAFDAPAPRRSSAAAPRDSVLDPFSVYRKDPGLLAQELRAFHDWQLRRIIRDYELVSNDDADIGSMAAPQLAALILRRVAELSVANI